MIKRAFDIVLSFLGLILLSLPMLLIAAVVAFEGLKNGGNVIYRQSRVGRFGKEFRLLKFRTMSPGSDARGLLTVGGRDPRITPIGYLLRRFKLDELPQLLNVLKGDMSIVGPRPEVKKFVDMYSEEQRRVLELRPGLTDLASIRFFDENEILARSPNPEQTYISEIMPIKIELALKYADSQSLAGDIVIIIKTLGRMIR